VTYSSTLDGAITADSTDVFVDDAPTAPYPPFVQVGSELMAVVSVQPTAQYPVLPGSRVHIAVQRGALGTTRATHSDAAAIYAVTPVVQTSAPSAPPEIEVSVLSGHGAPAAGVNETQQVVYGDSFPITGTFRLTFGGDETTDIDVQSTLIEDIIALLEALPSIGTGNIEADGGTGDSFVSNGGELDVVFVGDLATQNVAGTLTVTTVNMMHNATPVTDASGFEVASIAGSPGLPPLAGTAAMYVDLDSGNLYVNTGDESAPTWVKAGPLGLAGVLAVDNSAPVSVAVIGTVQSGTLVGGENNDDGSQAGFVALVAAGTDTGGSAVIAGGGSADSHGSAIGGGSMTANPGVATTGGAAIVRGGASVGHVGGAITATGATVSADGGLVVTGLPTSDPGVAGQLYSNGAPSAGVPKALMVSGGPA
jgi:hypothetical protein